MPVLSNEELNQMLEQLKEPKDASSPKGKGHSVSHPKVDAFDLGKSMANEIYDKHKMIGGRKRKKSKFWSKFVDGVKYAFNSPIGKKIRSEVKEHLPPVAKEAAELVGLGDVRCCNSHKPKKTKRRSNPAAQKRGKLIAQIMRKHRVKLGQASKMLKEGRY